MIEIFKNPRYDFIGKRRWAYLISSAITVIASVSLVVQGLRYDVDFTGGTLIQVRFSAPTGIERLRTALDTLRLGDSVIQQFDDPREYIIRTQEQPSSSQELAKRIQAALSTDRSLGQVEIRRVDFVGPQVGRDLQMQAIYVVLAGIIAILAYIGFRFDLKGGVAAAVAIVHDVIVCLGALSLTRHEFSQPVLAGLLTVVGYSVNDTIVAYDRLREDRANRIPSSKSFAEQMNDAVNQTLSRTILTSLTTFFAAVTLLAFGGSALEGFAFVLTVGILTGTYSTTYIAAALVVDWTIYVERPQQVGRPQRRIT